VRSKLRGKLGGEERKEFSARLVEGGGGKKKNPDQPGARSGEEWVSVSGVGTCSKMPVLKGGTTMRFRDKTKARQRGTLRSKLTVRCRKVTRSPGNRDQQKQKGGEKYI